jgi:coenzyme F420-0:L-glutamate ligase / coenzyme F420-1:gamma-L-glutamate ligase
VLSLLPIQGLPIVEPGASLADLIVEAVEQAGDAFLEHDILAVAQKVVSKAEGRLVDLEDVTPSPRANQLARVVEKDPRLVELILRESRSVLRSRPGLLIVEDNRGFVCANAGIDRSNIQQGPSGETVALLPLDPDRSALSLRERIRERTGVDIGVLIIDSHGRAWREGTVGVTIGASGVPVVSDRRGDADLTGYVLQHTVIGLGDEIASAASILMGPADEGVPAVLVRGLRLPLEAATARDLQRPRERDLFR